MVGKWYKKEGDTVEKGEPIVEVVSEKATYDLEAPASGVLRKIVALAGVDLPVDAALAFIAGPDENIQEADLPIQQPQPTTEESDRVLASPAAKRLAREHGIDLSLIKPTNQNERITEEDVERFIQESKMGQLKIKETISLSGLRKTSAERVSASFRTAPHSTVMMEVNVSKAKTLHEKLQVSYTAILVNSVANALAEHSIINSTLAENTINIFESVNVGVAVATENGLIVPVIHDANKKTIEEIDVSVRALTEKAKQGKLTKEELTGGTFTITNLGMYDVDFFTPIINPPEAAILGVGKITEKPVAINGKIAITPMMMLSLSYDHRIVDGAPAAEFLRKVKEKIESVS
jgi:pyruvate dehydrogenase E2 component (dihydrolipoamide acetyltransferase)